MEEIILTVNLALLAAAAVAMVIAAECAEFTKYETKMIIEEGKEDERD